MLVIFQTDPGINVEMVTAEDGFLDLGDWDIDAVPSLNVTGNWEVYSDVLLDPNHFTDRSFFLIPDAYLPLTEADDVRNELTNTTGLWTYRLRVILPEDQRLLGLAFKDVMMASKVFVNGIEVGGSGEVGLEDEVYEQKRKCERR